MNGKIYAIGGVPQLLVALPVTSVEEYDPATNIWTIKQDMPTARQGLTTSVVNGKIYAIGGARILEEICSVVEEYDPIEDSWTTRMRMPGVRTNVVVGGDLDGAGQAIIKDLGTAESINTLSFSDGLTPIDAQGVSDFNNNNVDDIALLVREPQEVQPKVEVRNPLSGNKVKNVDFNKQHEPVDLVVLPDKSLHGNANPELGVMVNPDSAPQLRVRDSVTKTLIQTISLP